MAVLQQFNYIFAIAMIFGFLDAFNIGANDVANSWASSVSSRSLKYWQAMVLAAICELLGAVLVGSRVSDTIKNKIIDVSLFEDDPAVLLLTMTCALVGSSLWLTFATLIGLPVSTTHSIVGGIIGAGIAAKSASSVVWGWDGVAQIIASWFIAPLLSGILSSVVFLISKYGVLEIKDFKRSLKNALLLGPILTLITFSILTMLIVWKGSPSLNLDDLSQGATVGSILGVGGVAMVIYTLFLYPFYRRKLVYEDWTLRFYDVWKGPMLYFQSTNNIPPIPEGHNLVIDYYAGRRHETETSVQDAETHIEPDKSTSDKIDGSVTFESVNSNNKWADLFKDGCPEGMRTKQFWGVLAKSPAQWPYLLWQILIHGWNRDVINSQVNDKDMLSGDLKKMHSKSKYYDNRIEHMYSFLQALTAGTMSFAHGANDIANATGPLSAVYIAWTTNTIGSKADTPLWILGYAGVALVIGCWTLGYKIMKNLGNKMILQSPSRGFAIELGAAVTTVMATQLAIPVSTTQSAVGSIVFVGLCNKDVRSVNWRMVIWCYFGWFFTLPVAGLIAGLLNAIILHAPREGGDYQLS
ncbi:Na+/Pi symporter [Yamadazyma tenuis]|uniref:Phosphate transporter n=1 Tax=Candida tenuis (strain ATCC 10573 / BCRC 21748 / CBS 615 / JCM 9827 / NBRC 10315 / NRRL Y-1498 / VKM Y-70) TaxID=590646 RepID=G3B975_CANTC|nr:uncharacterized protein CANTEDRAFT_125031 [Yamadazyma tenuis ATCC 10573]EGV61832.1 hypothetical protein CANTEDRAFT_125031 [Yamadazyma tenuis ATCC 10573]WEJ93056.1 Na+/Pi symporter [Yamadazyma tenuis]